MSITSFLGLNIPDKNSKGRVVTDVFEPNFTKIDQNAEIVDVDKNAIWGGEYGGYIQDTSVTKVVGKRYIDQFDKKAYECLVPSHENTISNYQACNVKDNLSKLNNLSNYESMQVANGTLKKFVDGTCIFEGWLTSDSEGKILIPGIMKYFANNPPVVLSQVYVNKTGEKDYSTVYNYDANDITIYTILKGVVSYKINCSVFISGNWK
ncbi:MAG: hypothetical protein ACRCX2_32190 [Paraclostridium sp.]